MGESSGGAGAWVGNHGGLEAHRGDGGGKNWQKSPDVRAGGGGGNHRHGDDRRGGWPGLAGQYDTRAIVGRGRNDAGKFVRAANGHCAQPAAGLGADAARGHDAVRVSVLRVSELVQGLNFGERAWSRQYTVNSLQSRILEDDQLPMVG